MTAARDGHVQWVFFDLDGTLADSVAVLFDVYRAFMSAQGLAATAEEFARLNGPSIPEIVEILRQTHHLSGTYAELLDEYRQAACRAYRTSVEPMPGAAKVCGQLHAAGMKLALVTAAEEVIAREFLAVNDWCGVFDVRVFGNEVSRAKPAPDLYELALQRAGVPAVRAVVVEDSPNGVRSASGAGLSVLLYDPHHQGDGARRPAGVRTIISHLEEIPDAVYHRCIDLHE